MVRMVGIGMRHRRGDLGDLMDTSVAVTQRVMELCRLLPLLKDHPSVQRREIFQTRRTSMSDFAACTSLGVLAAETEGPGAPYVEGYDPLVSQESLLAVLPRQKR